MLPKCCMCRKSIKSGEYYYIMQGRTTCIECGKKFNSTKCVILNKTEEKNNENEM